MRSYWINLNPPLQITLDDPHDDNWVRVIAPPDMTKFKSELFCAITMTPAYNLLNAVSAVIEKHFGDDEQFYQGGLK